MAQFEPRVVTGAINNHLRTSDCHSPPPPPQPHQRPPFATTLRQSQEVHGNPVVATIEIKRCDKCGGDRIETARKKTDKLLASGWSLVVRIITPFFVGRVLAGDAHLLFCLISLAGLLFFFGEHVAPQTARFVHAFTAEFEQLRRRDEDLRHQDFQQRQQQYYPPQAQRQPNPAEYAH